MTLIIIACIDKNYSLGKDNKLLYHIKEDMSFFKEKTYNNYIVMGKNTLLSLNGLLKNRRHLVISRTLESSKDIKVFNSIESFLNCKELQNETIYVIGGSSIYKELLPYTSIMYLTEVDKIKEADSYFPKFNKDNYNINLLGEYKDNDLSYKRLCYTLKERK